MKKLLFLLGIFGILTIQNSYAENKNQTYNLVYKMKVVKFWDIKVNWRFQNDYPTIGQKEKQFHREVTKILNKEAKAHSYMEKSFTLK